MNIRPLDNQLPAKALRTGLPKNTAVPHFTVEMLDGGKFDSTDFQGKKTLVVLSSADCAPCDTLLKHLPSFTQRVPELQVVIVASGSSALVRGKHRDAPSTYRIGLQEHHSVSRQFGMFATPSAFFIDEEGIVAADPAVGFSAIIRLVIGAALVALLEVESVLESIAARALHAGARAAKHESSNRASSSPQDEVRPVSGVISMR